MGSEIISLITVVGLPQQDCQEEGDHRNRVACCRCNGCRGVLEAYVVQVHTQCVPTNSKITKSTQSTQSLKFYLPCNTGQVLHAHTLAMHRRTASGTTRMTWVVHSSCKSYSMHGINIYHRLCANYLHFYRVQTVGKLPFENNGEGQQ